MKKIFLSIIASCALLSGFGQATTEDKLFEHNGEIIKARVTGIDKEMISYQLPGEEVQRIVGKLAVEKIEYGNGRTENISDKIEVNGKNDWEKVRVVYDANEVAGLKKGNEIYGKTPYWSVSNIAKEEIEKKAIRNLKKSAAKDFAAPIVLIISDQKAYKKGIVYSY